jgi:hypothetical protein
MQRGVSDQHIGLGSDHLCVVGMVVIHVTLAFRIPGFQTATSCQEEPPRRCVEKERCPGPRCYLGHSGREPPALFAGASGPNEKAEAQRRVGGTATLNKYTSKIKGLRYNERR